MKFFNKLKSFWPIFLLIIIELILFFTNYVPKTYFLGWDNLFPQLNFAENLRRSLFAVWEEYRGLGFLDGMSFAANLPYYILLYLTSFFLPDNLIRYFSIFFLHFLGGIGIYSLLNNLLKASRYQKATSFLGALFYLFNFGTMQMFYAPYELFSIHFAFLPWLVLFIIRYLENGRKQDLIVFTVLSFISASQAHVPTVFIVYLIMVFALLFFYFLKEKKLALKKIVLIILVTIFLNAFWSFPYAYYGLTGSRATVESKINEMSTESAFLINKARGTFIDVALIRGFWLDYTDVQKNGQYQYIMPNWRAFSQKTPFMAIGFFFFILSLSGLVLGILKREQRLYPFIFTFIFSFLMLGTDIPVVNSVFNFFYKGVPLFSQVFRFTFTKFSILYVFSYSILLSLSLSLLLRYLKKIRVASMIASLVFILLLFYYSFPSFQGQFIYNNLRIKIPNDYFALTNYFKNQNTNQRIALLPQTSYWGWTYTQWGYRGSGFIWYGLPQPSMDGSIFPWSAQNENYYWEIDQAINSGNQFYLETVLQKYQINWLIIDNSTISQYSANLSFVNNLHQLIKDSTVIKKTKSFGRIDVYKINQSLLWQNFVSVVSNLPEVGPSYKWNSFDAAYLENGNYINSNQAEVVYPFRTLFTGREQKKLEFKVVDKGSYYSFQSQIPTTLAGGTLIIPNLTSQNFPVQIYLDGELIKTNLNYSIANSAETKVALPYISKGKFEVRIPKITTFYDYNTRTSGDLFNRVFRQCNPFNVGQNKQERIFEDKQNVLRLSNYNSTICFDFNLPYNSQQIAYLIKIENRNLQGKSLLFSIINRFTQKPNFESNLPQNKNFTNSYFIIPPMENNGVGYDLYFYNVSLGNVKSINELANIEVREIPYDFLLRLKIQKMKSILRPVGADSGEFEVSHPNPSLYGLKMNFPQQNTTLILSQSFDPGWHAYKVNSTGILSQMLPFLFGKRLEQHIEVNNWENGWKLINNNQQLTANDKSLKIVIVYLPQYLEYLGMILGLFSLVFIIFKGSKI